tara:strand:- start:514 stop:993 length:480 start_codon:yes stop_codon:yes gene_type:complete
MINIYDIENDLLGKTEILVDNNIPKKTNSSEENDSIIDLIIKTSQNILDTLGTGFIEGIYHKALVIDFNKMNYNIETKKIIPISYKNINIGYVESDIVINTENNIYILELKSFDRNISQKEILQTQKYIKFIDNPDNKLIKGIVINFNQKTKNIDYYIL